MKLSGLCGYSAIALAVGCGSEDEEAAATGGAGAGGAGDAGASAEATYEAGFALRDLSPNEAEIAAGELYMGAYGVVNVQQRPVPYGVHDPVYARTLVIRSGSDAIALTILDMPGTSNRIIRAIVAAASEATGIDPKAIFVGSTHTHSGPDLQGVWGGVPDGYRQRVIDLTVESIVEAAEATEPAELVASKGTAPNRNRRGWEMTDEELTVLSALDASGDRIATLVQFAAHPVKLGAGNLWISRDFIGYTVDQLEQELGGPALYFNGIVGDCSPDGGESEAGCTTYQCNEADAMQSCFEGECEYQAAQSYGAIVADAALAAIDAGSTTITGGLTHSLESWEQEVVNPLFVGLADAGYLDYDIVQNGELRGIETQGGYFRLGTELQGVAFPGEALTRTGALIKDEMKADYRLFLGLTTDSLGYFVLADEFNTGRNGDYEETMGVGQGAAERAVEVIGGLVTADNASF